MAKNKEQE